jgi:hypothetical protein
MIRNLMRRWNKMTKHNAYTAFLALFVFGSATVPLQAQTQREDARVAQSEQGFFRHGAPVKVYVTNNNWLDLRIFVVETTTAGARWPLGRVTGKSTAGFEIPDHLGADLGNLVLIAESIGSRPQLRTERLQTWPGALVDWSIGAQIGLSFITIS